ncbi:SET domain-containing protein [Artomyces pyxidatus]|uniref:SET domain-containing protein n=1 Tax=Artomyces pyxidatus TaxID=48021 RepID=A0ACB8SYJ8_9AGAM|nr:SET domain-containing protein [Artomyces pyxidatus]
MSSARVQTLLAWCASQRIRLAPAVHLVYDAASGVSVRTGAHALAPGQTLVTIPKGAVLSARACGGADAAVGLDAQLALARALLGEQRKGRGSRWWGYLQSLPSAHEWTGIGLFWGVGADDAVSGGADGRAARRWLLCTEAGALLGDSTLLQDAIREYYDAEVRRWYPEAEDGGWVAFRQAFALVSARAFLVDGYHGLALVPVADAFNHTGEHDVQLETDFDVCPECGALGACSHDGDAGAGLGTESEEDVCEMRTVRCVCADSEVFNTYGAGLGSAELVVRYGFTLDPGEWDVVRFPVGETTGLAGDATDGGSATWEGSELVGTLAGLAVSADGVVSHGLWAACAAGSGWAGPLGCLAEAQVRAESGAAVSAAEAAAIARVCAAVAGLCRARVRRVAQVLPATSLSLSASLSSSATSAAIARTSGGPRREVAAGLALAEVSVLEACIDAWESLKADVDRAADGVDQRQCGEGVDLPEQPGGVPGPLLIGSADLDVLYLDLRYIAICVVAKSPPQLAHRNSHTATPPPSPPQPRPPPPSLAAMDTQWCLTCNRHLEGDADVYCSPACYNYDNPNTPSAPPRQLHDPYRWPGSDRAGILAWAHAIPPDSEPTPAPAAPPSLRPSLLQLRRAPLPPSLSVPASAPSPSSVPRSIPPTALRTDSVDDSATVTTATTADSIATPYEGSARERRGIVGAIAKRVGAWVGPRRDDHRVVVAVAGEEDDGDPRAFEPWGSDAMLSGWFAKQPQTQQQPQQPQQPKERDSQREREREALRTRGRKPARAAYVYC